ncbi:MAG: DUF501 domain-containing protein [Planctomycetota bacterium]|nr:DUF501 domain-containing protein [Planctomycetota bacterium]
MNEEDLQLIEQQLGRPPSGLQEVMKRNHNGFPAVLRVATMVEHNPFPTLFWLSDVQLNKWIHDLESAGMIERVQRIIDESAEFRNRLICDHQKHVELRRSYYQPEVKREIERLGVSDLLDQRGVGGVFNFNRVRCLHAFLAAHLVVPNLVGELLSKLLEPEDPLLIALAKVVPANRDLPG